MQGQVKQKRGVVILLLASLLVACVAAAAIRWKTQSGVWAAAADVAATSSALAPLPSPGRRPAADQLITKWSAEVERIYGTSPEAWARAMRPTLSRLSEAELQQANEMPSLDLMLAATTQKLAMGTAASSAADPALAGSATSSSLSFRKIAPCRLADTRLVNARLQAGGSLHVNSAGTNLRTQGGNTEGCGIPAGAEAIVINVTAVDPTQAGYLTVFPYGEERPLASSLNYIAGGVAGNEVIAKQAKAQAAALSVYSYAAVDIVVDAVGYFAQPAAHRMACVNHTAQYSLSAGFYTSYPVYCPSTFQDPDRSIAVGGSCVWQQDGANNPSPGVLSGALRSNGYTCDAENRADVDRTFVITAICCRTALVDG